MSLELYMLLLAALIPLVMVAVQGTALTLKMGMGPLLGNRERFAPPAGWPGRYIRAHANQIENLVPFGLLILVAHAAGVSNEVTRVAAEVFLGARLVHAASYIAGILYIRTAAFYAGLLAMFAIALQLL
ncbi:MAPEG family protein [Oleomonas cavernae]|nr:MAPEG family protein [Oleomonas cavernae]